MQVQRVAALTLFIWFIFVSILATDSLASKNVSEAKKFMKAKMFLQAIALLDAEINQNPTNADAHFQFGICYVNQKLFPLAEKRFASAVALKPDYGYKIAEVYIQIAKGELNNHDYEQAHRLLKEALKYQPDLKMSIAKIFMETGNVDMNRGNFDGASICFSKALDYNQNLKNGIADAYFKLSNCVKLTQKIVYLRISSSLNSKYKDEYIDTLSALLHTSDRDNYIDEAKRNGVGKEKLFETSIKYYTKILGEPDFIVKPSDDWTTIVSNPKIGDTIYYLSPTETEVKDNKDQITLKEAYEKHRRLEYKYKHEIKGPMLMKTNSILYIWIKVTD